MKSPGNEIESLINVEKDRLISLIEFSQHSARLRGKPAASISAHNLFTLFEHEIQGLPGIRINVNGLEAEDEVWLIVERLRETMPPDVANPILRPWIQMAQGPTEEPRLCQSISGGKLIAAGIYCSTAKPIERGKPAIAPEATITLVDYKDASLVRSHFETYLVTKWRPWAEEEKLRRKTIRLYSHLFTLKQQLEGSIVEAQLELVWGVGIGIWNCDGVSVNYPLVGRLVELSFNLATAEIEIRPRDVDARVEIDWYASVDNPGVAAFEKTAKDFWGKFTTTFSPFDHGT
jgi:hypothetical protein